MNDWRDSEGEGAKRWLLIGVGVFVSVVAWMCFARPGDEALSSRGFDLGSSAAAPNVSAGRPFERKKQTGLDFAGSAFRTAPLSVRGDMPGTSAALGAASAGEDSAAFAPVRSDSAGTTPPSPAEDMSAADKQQAERLGVPKTPAEAADFGGRRDLWSSLMPKVAAYPRVLGFLLNNKYVVQGYMNREKTKEVCSSPKAMGQYLFDSTKPDGATRDLPIFMQIVRANPEVGSVIAGSKLAQDLINCPGTQGVLSDPSLMKGIKNNPQMLGVLTDPAVIRGLTSTPASAKILSSF